VVSDLVAFCGDQGLNVQGTVESSLLGPRGNREFFILALKS
jgi:predicted rRNA methylase YqxC with S4 and FtsJ domains